MKTSKYKYYLLALLSLAAPLLFFKQSIDFSKSKKTISDSSYYMTDLKSEVRLRDTIIRLIRDSNYFRRAAAPNPTIHVMVDQPTDKGQASNPPGQDKTIELITENNRLNAEVSRQSRRTNLVDSLLNELDRMIRYSKNNGVNVIYVDSFKNIQDIIFQIHLLRRLDNY